MKIPTEDFTDETLEIFDTFGDDVFDLEKALVKNRRTLVKIFNVANDVKT